MAANDNDDEPREPYSMGGQDWRRLGVALQVLMIVGFSAFAPGSFYKILAWSVLIMGFYFFCIWLYDRSQSDG